MYAGPCEAVLRQRNTARWAGGLRDRDVPTRASSAGRVGHERSLRRTEAWRTTGDTLRLKSLVKAAA